MKNFLKGAGIFLLGIGVALAVTGNLSYRPPTTNTDGSVLLEQELDFYTYYCDGLPYTTFDSIIGNRTEMINLNGLTSGNHVCDLRVTNLDGIESGPSNVNSFSIGPRTPNPPTAVTIILPGAVQ